jgi:hypothetical protein
MTDTTYNGWTNRETWLTNLHFEHFTPIFQEDTEEGIFDEMDADEILEEVAEYIETFVDDYISESVPTTDNFIADVIQSFINEVDWRDIAQHYVADIVANVAIRNKDNEEAALAV